ncbi:hypothetical protein VNI00_016377 [Paramarasmius palmivorus]|uniref:Uncharacterized protein n=1 Tax=Paramarasmius palmivorus TaxID=297713 RepID=A0AAW0BF89_9AGAR
MREAIDVMKTASASPQIICTYVLYRSQYEEQMKTITTVLNKLGDEPSLLVFKSLLRRSPTLATYEYATRYCIDQTGYSIQVNNSNTCKTLGKVLENIPKWESVYDAV